MRVVVLRGSKKTRCNSGRPGSCMSAVVLAGGSGTRLGPLGEHLPKVLLPVDSDHVVLDRLLERITEAGINDVHLLLGRHEHLVETYLRVKADTFSCLNLSLHFGTGDLGTAAPLRFVRGRPGAWLVLNGDIVTDLTFVEVLLAHRDTGADVTVVGVELVTALPFGVLSVQADGSICGIEEKPVVRSLVSAGVNVLGPRARQLLQGGSADMPQLISECVQERLKVRSYVSAKPWLDLGSEAGHEFAVRTRSRLVGQGKEVHGG